MMEEIGIEDERDLGFQLPKTHKEEAKRNPLSDIDMIKYIMNQSSVSKKLASIDKLSPFSTMQSLKLPDYMQVLPSWKSKHNLYQIQSKLKLPLDIITKIRTGTMKISEC